MFLLQRGVSWADPIFLSEALKRIPLLESRDHCARRERGGTDMSWIYGSSGGTGFWDEQCKSERRIKEKWATTFGVDLKAKKEAEVEAEKAEAAKAEADRLAR